MIKAIETRYKGCRFRSRTEARWAVFMDTLGVAWQYEPEGFELPSGNRYLPDFYLPAVKTYLEIKPDVSGGWEGKYVYLAGPMSSPGEPSWRDRVRNIVRCGPNTRKDHGPDLHGVCMDSGGDTFDGAGVVDDCLESIRGCDELWAWIPDRDRYGTVSEIGYAKALGKPVHVAIGNDAVIPHPRADITDSVSYSCHGQLYAHELWFIEEMSDECWVGITEDEMASLFSCSLTVEESLCAELSRSNNVIMARGAPGECRNPLIYFMGGRPIWRGWPMNLNGRKGFDGHIIGRNESDVYQAIVAAKSARFEFGECG